MADEFIRGGVPRDMNIGGIDLNPAEGETITYMLSGRSGPSHTGGNGGRYKESNPHSGGFNQTVSVGTETFERLQDLAGSQEKFAGYFTIASGVTYNVLEGSIDNDGALENDNGTVALEVGGNVEKQ